ncbi:MAG: hypothetical protein U1F33_10605 [Alphaproteobacteria bacterium]
MRSRLSPLARAALAAAFLAACGSSESAKAPPATSAAVALCSFGITSTPTVKMSTIALTGALVDADIDLDAFREKGVKTIPTALARPKKTRYQAEQRQDCYNAQAKHWYPCVVKMDIDLTPAAGVNRASDMKTAMFYAVHNCERVTAKMADDALKTGMIHSEGLACEIVEQKYCELPPK